MDILILFTDYYFATKADALLAKEGIKHQLIPTPTALDNTCGLCILLPKEQLHSSLLEVLTKLQQAHISHSGIYAYDKSRQVCERLTISLE